MCDPRDLGTTLGETSLDTEGMADADNEDAPMPMPRRAPKTPTSAAGRGKPGLIPGYSPTLFLYEHTPGGIGLSERIFVQRDLLLARAMRLVEGCPCVSGCPGCVGPAIEATPILGVPPEPPQRALAKHVSEARDHSAEREAARRRVMDRRVGPLEGAKPQRTRATGRKATAMELMRHALGTVRALAVR
jgi:hypothetical protein